MRAWVRDGMAYWGEDLQLAQIYFTNDVPAKQGKTILNAADAETKGAELEITAVPVSELNINFAVAYLAPMVGIYSLFVLGVGSYVAALTHNWFGWRLDPTNCLTILLITGTLIATQTSLNVTGAYQRACRAHRPRWPARLVQPRLDHAAGHRDHLADRGIYLLSRARISAAPGIDAAYCRNPSIP